MTQKSLADTPQAHTITVGDQTIHYWEHNNAQNQTLILLQGGYGDAALHWHAMMSLLPTSRHLVAPDLPGYGASTALPSLSYETLLAWLHDFLNAIAAHQVILMGNSFGGIVARLFAAAHPERVTALILVNGGVFLPIPAVARVLSRTPALGPLLFGALGRSLCTPKALARSVYVPEILTDFFLQRVQRNSSALTQALRLMNGYRPPEQHIPQAPTLIVWGTNDTTYPLGLAEALQQQIPHARLARLDGCGHMPHLEAPPAFVAQVQPFLAEVQT